MGSLQKWRKLRVPHRLPALPGCVDITERLILTEKSLARREEVKTLETELNATRNKVIEKQVVTRDPLPMLLC